MANCTGISAFPENDDLMSWIGTITGPEGTVYAGRSYKISMKFPANYPYAPPVCRFETPLFHPNVDERGGICLDILKVLVIPQLKDKWSAVYSVQTLLLSIQSLLEEPNNESPLNGEAAKLWSNQAGKIKAPLTYFRGRTYSRRKDSGHSNIGARFIYPMSK